MEPKRPRHVLLADDVRLFLDVTKSFFSREHLRLTITQGGVEALKTTRALRPDLVIMNQSMRDLRGDLCCRRIKEDPATGATPVILLVDANDPEGEAAARAAGCDHLLTKPFHRQQLLDLARAALQLADRAAPRETVRMLVRYGVDRQELLHDYTVNLSIGGIFLETRQLLPVATQLSVEFLVPGSAEPILAKGQVAWVNPLDGSVNPELPPGFGIHFLDLEREEEWLIRNFLQGERRD